MYEAGQVTQASAVGAEKGPIDCRRDETVPTPAATFPFRQVVGATCESLAGTHAQQDRFSCTVSSCTGFTSVRVFWSLSKTSRCQHSVAKLLFQFPSVDPWSLLEFSS